MSTNGRHVRTESTSGTTSKRLGSVMVALAALIAGADGRHAR